VAPLRFGAGIKGKIVEAWNAGTPVITTSIGSEGMHDEDLDFGGVVAESAEEFIHAAINLYIDEKSWGQKQQIGRGLIENLYGMQNWTNVGSSLISTICDLEERRQLDFTRGVLWQQSLRSTEYFSRWIEQKERKDD
jgi:glycosyltransferase involved in cell wall biosynthesis